MQLKNQWALVTGASSGIGKAFAERLAREGTHLVLVARNQLALESLAAQLKRQHSIDVVVMSKDLSQLEAPQEIFNEVELAGININILINNAGMGVYGKLHETQLERNQQLLMLNIVALSSLTQLFLPPMLAQKSGVIINVASIAAFQPTPFMSNYGASKSFVHNFTAALWAEYVRQGIRILCVCPGPTETNYYKAMGRDLPKHGEFAQADDVVDQAMNALRQRKLSVICGRYINVVVTQLARLFTTKFSAKIAGYFVQKLH